LSEHWRDGRDRGEWWGKRLLMLLLLLLLLQLRNLRSRVRSGQLLLLQLLLLRLPLPVLLPVLLLPLFLILFLLLLLLLLLLRLLLLKLAPRRPGDSIVPGSRSRSRSRCSRRACCSCIRLSSVATLCWRNRCLQQVARGGVTRHHARVEVRHFRIEGHMLGRAAIEAMHFLDDAHHRCFCGEPRVCSLAAADA